jgi:hypothetical protein
MPSISCSFFPLHIEQPVSKARTGVQVGLIRSLLRCIEKADAEQIKTRSAIHLAFDHFEPVYVALGLAIAPR